MPLDILGSIAASGSSGASARSTARVSESPPSTASSRDAAPSVRSEAEPKEEVRVSAPNAGVAVFVSPFIRFDITARLAIVEIRNSETGEVQQQYPSPRAVREYQQNLPEDSSLRSPPGQDNSQFQPRIVGSTEDRAADAAAAAPAPSGQTPAAPSTNPQAAAASAAAFSNLQGVPTGGKQNTVA
ncbi:MAG: hypothetical protein VW600_07630 [Ferrovibrio sp.]